MIKVSKSLPDIAVLRGGNKDFKKSLSEGVEVLSSLKKIGYSPLDILIEKDGSWNLNGKKTDAHEIFTRAHTVIDVTKNHKEAYQKLAKDMGVLLLLSSTNDIRLDREDLYRLLRQKNIKTPETYTIRSSSKLTPSTFRDIWSKYHIPLMIRPIKKDINFPSRLVKSFKDFEEIITDYHTKGIDTHVLTYKNFPTTSVAVIPDFRGETLYMPMWVNTFAKAGDIPNKLSSFSISTHAPDFRKDQIKIFINSVCDALDISSPICIDIIEMRDGHMVVNVDMEPSLLKDGRFMKSLESTGVSIGEYIHSQIVKSI